MKTFGEWNEFRQALWAALETGHDPDVVDAIHLTCQNIGEQIARDNKVEFHDKLTFPPKRRLKKKARLMISTLQTGLTHRGIQIPVSA